MLSSISLSELHSIMRGKPVIKLLLSVSTLLGILVGYYISSSQSILHMLMGAILGMLLYITIVDSIPKEREGRPGFFLLGVVTYSLIIMFSWAM